MRIVAQLAPLAATGIGEEYEAALVDSFQQDEADGGLSVARRRRKRHRFVVRDSHAARIVEPSDELRNRVVAAHRHDGNHRIADVPLQAGFWAGGSWRECDFAGTLLPLRLVLSAWTRSKAAIPARR